MQNPNGPAAKASVKELKSQAVAPVAGDKLQKAIAAAGLCSRRQAEVMISEGKVSVNGDVARLGDRVKPQDRIDVNGREVKRDLVSFERRVILYNKPEGEVCSTQDEAGRPLVFKKLPRLFGQRWVMVGRLDINTSGLLLFTNDGELASRLMHPSYEIEREYAVRVLGEVREDQLQQLLQGVELEDGPARFKKLMVAGGTGANQWFHVTIQEGRKREVRLLWESQGLVVSRLKRIRYGIQKLGSLKAGQQRELALEEIKLLSDQVQLETLKASKQLANRVAQAGKPPRSAEGRGRGSDQGRGDDRGRSSDHRGSENRGSEYQGKPPSRNAGRGRRSDR